VESFRSTEARHVHARRPPGRHGPALKHEVVSVKFMQQELRTSALRQSMTTLNEPSQRPGQTGVAMVYTPSFSQSPRKACTPVHRNLLAVHSEYGAATQEGAEGDSAEKNTGCSSARDALSCGLD